MVLNPFVIVLLFNLADIPLAYEGDTEETSLRCRSLPAILDFGNAVI